METTHTDEQLLEPTGTELLIPTSFPEMADLVEDTIIEGAILGATPKSALHHYDFKPVPYLERLKTSAKMSQDDFGIGQRIALHFREQLSYVKIGGGNHVWFVYDDSRGVWIEDPKGGYARDIARRVIASLEHELEHIGFDVPHIRTLSESYDRALRMPEGDNRDRSVKTTKNELDAARGGLMSEHMKFVKKSKDGKVHIEAALDNAAALLRRNVGEFDKDPESINTPLGLLNLRTMELTPPNPDNLCTKVTNVGYRRGACHQDVDAILGRLDDAGHPGLMNFMQRFLGTGLTGYTPGKIYYYQDGLPDTAKSSVLQGFTYCLSDDSVTGYAVVTKAEIFVGNNMNINSANLHLHELRGKRYVFCDEANKAGRLGGIFKQYVSGEPMQSRANYGDLVPWTPFSTLAMAGNGMIEIPTDDEGVVRRFRGSLLTKAVEVVDFHLRKRLKEQAQMEAFFAWAVEGANMWLLEGGDENALHVTDQIIEETARYVGEADPMTNFVEDFIEIVDEDQRGKYLPLTAGAWAALYSQWSQKQGGKKLEDKVLRQAIRALGKESAKTRRRFDGWQSDGLLMMGLKLKNPDYLSVASLGHIKRVSKGEEAVEKLVYLSLPEESDVPLKMAA
ncbi:hypothetical protein [Paeniglutamicibacter sp.]|uniref:hypothetical protein n=1 Tax=Paeniglutamicibacter sp. TaxID=1934391 RepID=UPI00398A2100